MFVHFMESKGSHVIEEYLKNLHKDMQNPETIYDQVRVLAFSEEQKERVYDSWGKEMVQYGGGGGSTEDF